MVLIKCILAKESVLEGFSLFLEMSKAGVSVFAIQLFTYVSSIQDFQGINLPGLICNSDVPRTNILMYISSLAQNHSSQISKSGLFDSLDARLLL